VSEESKREGGSARQVTWQATAGWVGAVGVQHLQQAACNQQVQSSCPYLTVDDMPAALWLCALLVNLDTRADGGGPCPGGHHGS
jgi:hypothetical protein